MSLPYYKRFPRDFLEGTIGLSFETKGAYAIVLDLIYMRDGRLPDDARYIAGQLGCSVRKWTAILSELVAAGKLQVLDGIISNFRADYLTEESRKYQDKQAQIAGNPRKNKPLRQPQASQSEPEPDTTVTNVPVVRAPARPATRRCPTDWMPSAADLAVGDAEGLTPGEIDRALAKMRDHEFKTTRRDWSAVCRNWLRAEAERKPRNASSDRLLAKQSNLQSAWTGAERAAEIVAARRAG